VSRSAKRIRTDSIRSSWAFQKNQFFGPANQRARQTTAPTLVFEVEHHCCIGDARAVPWLVADWEPNMACWEEGFMESWLRENNFGNS
jgi:hypothetical protein